MGLPWYFLPQIELVRFKPVEFFPPKPERLGELDAICIGTKTRTIGDALMLTTLPRKLKARYPRLKILTYPRGFNPVVFWNNPHVDGITFTPPALYGDDCNEGSGQLLQLKENFFGLETDPLPRAELHLTQNEQALGKKLAREIGEPARRELPLLIIHPFGQTVTKVLSPELWSTFVKHSRARFRVVQVGAQGQTPIAGCDHHFLAPKKRHLARQLFALLSQAKAFVGVDSGPMHVARAFNVPSLILTDGAEPQEIFARRKQGPYFLHKNWSRIFLYEDLEHIHASAQSERALIERLSDFTQRINP